MEIKTTNDIINSEIPWKSVDLSFEQVNEMHRLAEANNKKWVAVDDIIEEITKHHYCKEYHEIDGEPAFCLDIILKTLKEA